MTLRGTFLLGPNRLPSAKAVDLLIVSTSEDAAKERRRVKALIARRIDGLIVVPADDESMAPLKGGSCLPPTV